MTLKIRSLLLALIIPLTLFFVSCDDLEELADALGLFADVEADFDEIAERTGGDRINAEDADDVPTQIIRIIEDTGRDNADIAFLIDKTSSMRDDIDSVKKSLLAIIAALPDGTRLALATYGDKNVDDDWYSSTELSTDYDLIESEIKDIEVSGGGDFPESVYDGIYETMSGLDWQSTEQRLIIVVGDASPLKDDKTSYDLDDISDKANELEINVYLIAIED